VCSCKLAAQGGKGSVAKAKGTWLTAVCRNEEEKETVIMV
jgi:hypothetical protein